MDQEKQDRDTIASIAIAIASAEERDAYIARACGDDAELRRQVEERAAAHDQAGSRVEPTRTADAGTPPPEQAPRQAGTNHAEGREPPITAIGPYKVLKQVGEGVAGIVFQAERQGPDDFVVSATPAAQGAGIIQAERQPPERPLVALKVIKDGMDWRQIVARFEAGRQALSLMDHPNIARVLGAGARQSGQPYFVMEWVDGVPITRYCDDHQLSPRQRLELFVPVCQAVQYAHQKGVIHGALKPSNVLVASRDGKPVPKVLDFGVPRAARGMPQYMSPDQADANVLDVDTRGDVYSLGVLLYELLTGTTPLTQERLKNVSMAEALRLIREEETPPPSTRLSESKVGLASVSAKRHRRPAALIKEMHGELDCLVMKALQKDRTRRYETAGGLARDIQRYLADEPLEACPPGTRNRLWNSARKHPLALAAAAVVLFLLLSAAVAGTGLAVWAFREEGQAGKAEDEAVEKQKRADYSAAEYKGKLHQAKAAGNAAVKELQRAQAAEKAAQRSEEETKAILDFFKKTLLSAGRPGDVSLAEAFWAGGKGKDVTLRKAVDLAESQLTDAFADRPLGEASTREILGLTYLNLGEAAQAVKEYERALALREAIQGVNHPDTTACRNQLAVAYRLAGRTSEAARLLDRNPYSPAHAAALAVRGSMLLSQKKPAEAELKLRECLAIREKIQPADWTTSDTKSILGEALSDQKRFAEAEPLLLSGYEGMKRREDTIPPQDKPRLTKALERLLKLYEAWDKKDKAMRWRKELEVAEATR